MEQENKLTIVMYHYVRELHDSRFPTIKGLTVERFIKQLNYFENHYTYVTMEDCLSAINTGKALPKNPILLTFDDGYIDHYTNVFPILSSRGIAGAFFPSAQSVLKHCVMDVNKIHYILASSDNITALLEALSNAINDYKDEYHLRSLESYSSGLNLDCRYDPPEIVLFKQLLQFVLPEAAREKIVDKLFKKFVQVPERVLAKELYMNIEQLKIMQRYGMYIGSHSFDHVWMDKLTLEQQQQQVELSLQFLKHIGADTEKWVMCYPYGAHNNTLVSLLKNKGCQLGLTTQPEIANLTPEKALVLPRLDTNDFPVWNKQTIETTLGSRAVKLEQ